SGGVMDRRNRRRHVVPCARDRSTCLLQQGVVDEERASGGGDRETPELALILGALGEDRRDEVVAQLVREDGVVDGADRFRLHPLRQPDRGGVHQVREIVGGNALCGGVVHLLPSHHLESDIYFGIGFFEALDLGSPEGLGGRAVLGDHERQFTRRIV